MNDSTMTVLNQASEHISATHISHLLSETELNDAFWQRYLQVVHDVVGCHIALILSRSTQNQAWHAIAKHPQRHDDLAVYADAMLRASEQVIDTEQPHEVVLPDQRHLRMHCLINATELQEPIVMALIYPKTRPDSSRQVGLLEQFLFGLPGHVKKLRETHEIDLARTLNERHLMQLMHDLCMHDHFLKSAYHLCNALVRELRCERVALGTMRRGRVHLTAVSQSAHFDRRAAVARDMIDAMEEAIDQDCIVQFPNQMAGRTVDRAHRLFSENHGQRTVVTLPFNGIENPFGALFLEYSENQPNAADLEVLRRFLNAAGPFLERSQTASRFFLIRYGRRFLELARWALGPRHVAAKLGGLCGALLLATVFMVHIEYRVDAKAAIRSEDLAMIPAPFDGFLSEVYADLGDQMTVGDPLLALDTRELLQEQSIAQADVVRYEREIEKALASRELAAMQIARAQLAQAEAKLALVRFRLDNAVINAPRTGIIVEGDLRKDLGSPVRQGDPLLKLAGTETLYLELEIDQSEIHLLEEGYRGEVALVGRPDQRIAFIIDRIDPVAQTRDASNLFIAKAQITADRQSWWRPGMGGTAKIDSGPQSLIWIMTHRTLNFLRTFFWL